MESLTRLSVSHGVPAPAPAVHCTVERLQGPVIGLKIRVSGLWLAGGAAGLRLPGDPGLAGPPRCRAWKVTSGAYQPLAVRH